MSIPTGPAPSPAPTADSQVAKIFEWRRGFNAMHLIDIGIQLGLFRALAATLTSAGSRSHRSSDFTRPT